MARFVQGPPSEVGVPRLLGPDRAESTTDPEFPIRQVEIPNRSADGEQNISNAGKFCWRPAVDTGSWACGAKVGGTLKERKAVFERTRVLRRWGRLPHLDVRAVLQPYAVSRGIGCHSVTSRSKRMISSSACFRSSSITSSGRGGVYL